MKERRLSKNVAIVCLVVMLAVLLGESAGAQPSSTAKKVWELRFATDAPLTGFLSKNYAIPLAKNIEEATHNRVKVTYYPAQMLGKKADQYDMTANGIADMTWVSVGTNPGLFPLTEMFQLPLLGFYDSLVGVRASTALYEQFKDVYDKQYSRVKVLHLIAGTGYYLYSTKPVRSLEDFKGMKIVAAGGAPVAMTSALGAVPVPIPTPEVYSALEKGVVSGAWYGGGAPMDFRFYEVAKYRTDIELYVAAYHTVMSPNTWNSFSKDIQEQIMRVAGVAGAELFAKGYANVMDDINRAKWKEVGEVITFPAADMAKIKALARPIQDDFVAKLEAKGLPAKVMLKALLSLIDKYNAERAKEIGK
jgi:TRAP-type C4-dicarboxylate transport system substrate-binding protein